MIDKDFLDRYTSAYEEYIKLEEELFYEIIERANNMRIYNTSYLEYDGCISNEDDKLFIIQSYGGKNYIKANFYIEVNTCGYKDREYFDFTIPLDYLSMSKEEYMQKELEIKIEKEKIRQQKIKEEAIKKIEAKEKKEFELYKKLKEKFEEKNNE